MNKELYERMVAVALQAVMQQVSIADVAKHGWNQLVNDVCDLADALTVEVAERTKEGPEN